MGTGGGHMTETGLQKLAFALLVLLMLYASTFGAA